MSKEYLDFLNKVIAFSQLVDFELSTRNFRDADEENLNIFDLLNNVDHVEKIIREEYRKYLKEGIGYLLDDDTAINLHVHICQILSVLTVFKNKWFIAYNFWYSSFKAERKNRENFNNGEEWLHITYQVQYPKFNKITKDIDKFFDDIDNHKTNIRQIRKDTVFEAKQLDAKLNKKSWIKRIFS
jgi:hypothetical protein